jgi:sugar phosphate isomerase/epimerase
VKKNNVLIGITIDRFRGIAPSVLLTIIKKMGVEFVEITKSVFDDLPPFIEQLGTIQTGFHLPNLHDAEFDFSFHERKAEIQKLIQLINRHHHELNVNYCLSHPPENRRSSLSEDQLIEYLLNNLNKLEVPIILENIQSWDTGKFENFYKQAIEILGKKLIGQCFDAPHYFLQGEDPVEYLKQRDGKINFIHLSDCRKGFDAHLPFGLNGELPVDDILDILKEQNFQGIINLELLPRNLKDIKPLIDSYLKVVRNFDHMKYLKSKFMLVWNAPPLVRKMKQVF